MFRMKNRNSELYNKTESKINVHIDNILNKKYFQS